MGEGPFGFALILLLLYMFVGVSVISDIFMESITVILGEKKMEKVVDTEGRARYVGVGIWNPRIANATLLALGSSAPEILLGFFSTFSSQGAVNSHTLAPSTLAPMVMVGSASFNLLVITAVAIVSV